MNLLRTDTAIEALRPGDEGYSAAAHVFFGTGAPALVARPSDPAEVAAVLDHAARSGRAVSVRSGGHSLLGHGTNTDGVVIDLAHMDRVDILDADRRLVRVGGGATWGQVAAALDPHGWALTAGDTAGVGVGGLTLGGGIGWLVRRDGLAIDNLVGARVVTADGRVITASPDEHADLFWALRGGGGNFGVVVDFDFVARPVAGVHFGRVDYALDDPADLLRRWRDAMRTAPDEVSSTLMLAPRMPGAAPSATVLLCYAALAGESRSDVEVAIGPLLALGRVTSASVAERRYSEILDDAGAPPPMRTVVRNALVPRIDGDTIEAVCGLYSAPGARAIAVRSLGAAFGRVPTDATAFAHRDAEAMVMVMVMVPDTADVTTLAAALAPWQPVAGLGTGPYLNFHGSATAEDLAAAYPPATRARLAAVKAGYDPGNRFALNHNIPPAPTQGEDSAA